MAAYRSIILHRSMLCISNFALLGQLHTKHCTILTKWSLNVVCLIVSIIHDVLFIYPVRCKFVQHALQPTQVLQLHLMHQQALQYVSAQEAITAVLVITGIYVIITTTTPFSHLHSHIISTFTQLFFNYEIY